MNYRVVFLFLSAVAAFLGVAMFLCLPWGLEILGGERRWEARGVEGLLKGAATSFAAASAFYLVGRGADSTRLYRKEAIAIVVFGWIAAILLGATPYLYGLAELRPGVPATLADAIFESASGLTTTGATVFAEVENPASLPQTLLMWRFATHFLGGLGVMCFFVALIGNGASGKAIMKLERGASGNLPAVKMRELAFLLFKIYVLLNVLCAASLLCCGTSFLDAIAHSFSTVATGGFSSRNASVASFRSDPNVNSAAIEVVLLIFMIVSSTNYALLYWIALGKWGKLSRDTEWRTYMAILILATVAVFTLGTVKRDFAIEKNWRDAEKSEIAALDGNAEISLNSEEGRLGEGGKTEAWPDALRTSALCVVSLASGAGFATTRYELWNSASLCVLALVMFCGGCSASTAGGAKIYRIFLFGKAISKGIERTHSPNVVRATRYNGENLERDALNSVVLHLLTLLTLIVATVLATLFLEPDAAWASARAPQIEKLTDLAGAALAMVSNVGPAFGKMGALENYGFLTAPTKLLYGCVMLVGRLEIWIILAVFAPGFWRNR
ncbi:MAG: TrkH family potassium uptake protein [Thermoguttaceae bacterium]|nr:TrkH family potassium uptake protein [Thermoguttaceae bacterium]